jgi:hypothetical protein
MSRSSGRKFAVTVSSFLVLVWLIGGALPRENTGFVHGHIFVAVTEAEACDFGGREWIVEIDPDTGIWSVFADSDDGLCVVSGLRFTPDGSRLLAANAGHLLPSNDGGWIQAFNPDGTSEVILDASDGLNRPFGGNCVAFDSGGDLYVVSAQNNRILRFPRDGSPAVVFADVSDGINGRGALEFSPFADLFYSAASGGDIRRINPAGQATFFTRPGFPSIAIDDEENLFAGSGGVVRWDGPGPILATGRILADGFNAGVIALSADAELVYLAEQPGRLHTIDAESGAASLLADFSALSALPRGATVYIPDPDMIPGRCCFGAGTSSAGCTDGILRPQCGDDEPGPYFFAPKENCPPTGPACEILSVSCCHGDPFGPCTDDIPVTECLCPTCTWEQFVTCDEMQCAASPIPTASAWGLTTLTLSLMIGAKIVFGQSNA